MSKKKKVAILICFVITILLNVYVCIKVKPNIGIEICELVLNISSDKAYEVQVFYAENTEFVEEQSFRYSYNKTSEMTEVRVPISTDMSFIRLDLGDIENKTQIYSIYIQYKNKYIPIDLSKIEESKNTNCIKSIQFANNCLDIETLGEDPYIVVSLENINFKEISDMYWNRIYLVYRVLLCIAIDLLCILCAFKIEKLLKVPLELYRNRGLVWDLSKNDFQSRFAGSYLGIFWAFVQPVIIMLLYWFVFQVGLRAGSVSEYPFILFLMSGMIPWFYFSEALNGATNSLMEYSYLVKKVVFEIDILPVIKIVSSIFVHLFFVAFIIIMCIIYGYNIDIYLLQLIYYILCTCFLIAGLSYITSACTAFFRDMTQIVNIFLTMGVWITPIMWNPVETLPEILQIILKCNPVYYIVDGFRDSLLAKEWFWDKPIWTMYFWIISILVYYIGISLYTRLKPHFSDVL